jgi:hypothetical protein
VAPSSSAVLLRSGSDRGRSTLIKVHNIRSEPLHHQPPYPLGPAWPIDLLVTPCIQKRELLGLKPRSNELA